MRTWLDDDWPWVVLLAVLVIFELIHS